ncbi:MAG TPA: TlpA disulfide reductase family protein, partial [Pyrinomonadaceae bacterium]|nr:TlpA disulfide reductase family protein [Pyrinomonadaceae bacterium]
KLRHAPRSAMTAGRRSVLGRGEKEKQMFLKSRKAMAVATLSIVIPISSFASLPRRTSVAPQAVEFSLRSIDGQNVSAQSLRGEVVVLAFGASWLPLSRNQLQGIRKLADKYSEQGVVVYWVSTDSEQPKSKNYATDEQLRAFSKKYGLNVTVLRDPDGKVSRQFNVDQLPAIVILDKQGKAGTPIGGLDPEGDLVKQLSSPLEEVLNKQ